MKGSMATDLILWSVAPLPDHGYGADGQEGHHLLGGGRRARVAAAGVRPWSVSSRARRLSTRSAPRGGLLAALAARACRETWCALLREVPETGAALLTRLGTNARE